LRQRIPFFSQILQDPNAPYQERKDAAKELLPYYHPKLASVEARAGGQTHEDRHRGKGGVGWGLPQIHCSPNFAPFLRSRWPSIKGAQLTTTPAAPEGTPHAWRTACPLQREEEHCRNPVRISP